MATVSATETSAVASRGFSDRTGYTNITAGESSGANTPPPGNHFGANGAPEVVSTPQAPTTNMRFDTLEDALRHYKMSAWRRGFGI
jgi:hypothetical protein